MKAPCSPLPPRRLILIGDNLAGPLSWAIVEWGCSQGVLPLSTPLSGSWLNLAESVPRMLVRRALAGQRPQTPEPIITGREETVDGWHQHPTPFGWGGKRRERRRRAHLRRLGGAAALVDHHAIPA